jgi:hypothetical protein
MSTPANSRMDRRDAIKWMLAAAATISVLERNVVAATTVPEASGYGCRIRICSSTTIRAMFGRCTLNPAAASRDRGPLRVIIPNDRTHRAPSAVHVDDFIDEWISAPYPDQRKDRTLVLEGLAWLDREAQKRFGANFADLVRQAADIDLRRSLPRRQGHAGIPDARALLQAVPRPGQPADSTRRPRA